MKRSKKIKVFAMMSGGVDSSVAAALLRKRGFNVVGVFMKNWDGGEECQWIEDERDARRVAAKIGIPFYVMNFEEEYRKRVFDPFIEGIKQGITPNPDVFCNTYIKFGIFLEKALALGADYVATGHYAKLAFRVERLGFSEKNQNPLYALSAEGGVLRRQSRYTLNAAKDAMKDQTYFLYRLNQFQLSKTIFPIGDYLKSEVRIMAKEFGLSTYNKPDSQGICFVGQAPFAAFLSQFIQPREGVIVDTNGTILGKHQGVSFYTIGQRRGMAIGGNVKPLFIAGKDIKTNTLTVVSEDDPSLYTKTMRISDVHWIRGVPPRAKEVRCSVRFRHQQDLQPCQITQMDADKDTDKRGYANLRKSASQSAQIRVQFKDRQRAITPGQSAVLYKGKEVLGGGIIA